jgi:5,10-methylenetetrahydrofolate reductase
MQSDTAHQHSFLEILSTGRTSVSLELRPPRANASGPQSMDDWIDIYHSVRRLTHSGRSVFITDSAVGQHEEENLRHLVGNLGYDARRSLIVPFLTCKHPLEYCLRYAERAYEQGFHSLVILGGDRHDGIPRCVEHASELRRLIRSRVPGLHLGGWANPHGEAERQVGYLAREEGVLDFFLTQVVSHHSADAVARFLEALDHRQLRIPAVFGVFYYRSAQGKTLQFLSDFFAVPAVQLKAEFEKEKIGAEAVCARSLSSLCTLGARHIYVSNLPSGEAPALLGRILARTAHPDS